MATMRDIKRRKSSIESTEQITKAMKLVATVKLQKSRTKADPAPLFKERGFDEKGSYRRFFQSRTCRRI